MRNYRRLHGASIPCPKPILLKSHVLIMEFLGSNGWPSPRLKDAQLKEKRMRQAYVQTILIMRHMFQRCRLVHGDLSEYNLLWHDNQVYVIDVSQSVESDHPSALDFLRKDASNVNDFFSKAGNLSPMTTRQLFDFITSTVIDNTEEAESKALDEIIEDVENESNELSKANIMEKKARKQQTDVDEAVFMSQFLPRSLNQVAEQDIRMIEEGEVEETYAHAVAALTGNKDVVNAVAKKMQRKKELSTMSINEDESQEIGSQEDDEVSLYEDELYEDSASKDTSDAGHFDSDGRFIKRVKTAEEIAEEKTSKRASMKAHKKAVKEARSEKRQTKIKKKDKRRAINKTKGNKKK